MKPNNDAERSERLGRLYTGAVADILDELGPSFATIASRRTSDRWIRR